MFAAGARGRNVHSSVLNWGLAQGTGVLPSAGKMSDACLWWRKEDAYPAKLQCFNPGDFCTGRGKLTSTFPRFSSILMEVVGSSAGEDFKYSTHITSCSQEIHFLKLWLIYGGVGACTMPEHFISCRH